MSNRDHPKPSRRRILLGPEGGFDPSQDIAIAPWCFLGEEHADTWFELGCEPDPFESIDRLTEADIACLAEAERLLPQLTIELNRRNGMNHSPRFWRVLILPWLLTLLHVVIERQLRVLALVQRYGDQPLEIVLTDSDIDWGFWNTSDFLERGVFGADFNIWLMSILLRPLLPAAWSVTDRPATAPVSPRPAAEPRGVRLKRLYLAGRRCRGIYGLGYGNTSGWQEARGLLISKLISALLTLKPTRPDSREPPAIPHPRSNAVEWPKCLSDLIWQTMPRAYLDLSSWVPPAPKARSGRWSLSLFPFADEIEKYSLACRIESGERVLLVQHGGNYGNARVFGMVNAIEYRLDRFVSWGWKRHGRYLGHIIPLPSPYLLQFADRHRRRSDETILVTTVQYAYCYRLDSVPQPGALACQTTNVIDFVDHLSQLERRKLVFRPYAPQPNAFDLKLLMLRRFPGLPLCEGPLHPRLMVARLVVLNHPGTTLNIALASNVPTVGFWDDRSWPMCDQAQPLFDALRRVGILHESGRSGAEFINNLGDDIDRWWLSQETQIARKCWVEEYARTSPSWLRTWIAALWRL